LNLKVGVNTLFMIPGEVGGSETYLRETLHAIAANHPGIALVLFTNRENDASLREELSSFGQIEFAMLDFKAANRYMRIVREQLELPHAARKAGIDLLWSPGYTAPFWAPCRQVVSILDMQYKSHPEDLSLVARLTTDLLVKMAAIRSRRIVAISDFTKGEIVKYTSARPGKIAVTPLGVERRFAEKMAPAELAQFKQRLVGAEAPYILCVSNTYPHKNIDAAVRAFGTLAGEIPHRFVLVGQPRLGEAQVAAAWKGLDDQSRAIRHTRLSRSDLIALYQGADIFLFPSRYEGFGLPVLEAMVSGTPVVASKVASIPEVGGQDIVYADPESTGELADAIRAVLAWSPEHRRERVESAKRRASQFNWRSTAERTIRVFADSIEKIP
jgi:glycosyltransferase involved in cell wall biosynthesis